MYNVDQVYICAHYHLLDIRWCLLQKQPNERKIVSMCEVVNTAKREQRVSVEENVCK